MWIVRHFLPPCALDYANEDGRARGTLVSVYKNLEFDEIEPLLPAIYQAVVEPAPSGIMFANGIRLSGLEILATHHIEEAMPLCLEVIQIEKWGKKDRIDSCLKSLQIYGGAAKPMLPKLQELEEKLLAHREAKSLKSQIELLHKTIAAIKASEKSPQLHSLDD